MKFFNFFKKKSEKKSYSIVNNVLSAINSFNSVPSSIFDVNSLTISGALEYYRSCAPLAKSVDKIAKGFSQIPIILIDPNDEFVLSHPILDLLNKPNDLISGTKFKRKIASYELITGNAFVEASGPIERPPLELYCRNPQNFSIDANYRDGYAEIYHYYSNTQSIDFFREQTIDSVRFITKDRTNELLHLKNFNPNESVNSLFGMIAILPILLDIEQFQRSSNHNLSLLKNGARLSALLMKEGVLRDDQYERLKAQINDSYTGDSNAGRIMLAESGDGKMDLKELSQNNKDMDFKENKKDVRFSIFNHYDIPLPLVSPDHMTMSNYSEARLALYEDAILPFADCFLEELSNFLIPRYPDLQGYKLGYNPQRINALLIRSNEDIKMKKESGVLTIDEIRSLYEYDPIEGGDLLYQPANLVPIGVPLDSDDNDAVKAAFKKVLKNAGYSNNKIDEMVKRNFHE